MYVCVCHAVTDRDIRGAANAGCCSLRELRERLDVGRTCGRCNRCARDMLKEPVAPRISHHPLTAHAAAA